jgi:hypothetical protein
MFFHLVQVAYWLALSTWFGGVLFIALAAPIIFRTVRDSNPVLPEVLSVNLENQHSTLLAGSIMANLLRGMARIEVCCAGVLFLALIAQWFLISRDTASLVFAGLRSTLYVAAVVLTVYHQRVISPQIWANRDKYIQHADEPEVANPAKESFDKFHRESVTILSIVLCLLLGMVLFSASITPTGGITFNFNQN